jgi:competence protein ComEA
MKRTIILLLAACLMFALFPASHRALAANAAGMLGTPKAVTGQTGLTQKTGQMLNLNTASAEQLTALPNIGPKTATAIVNKRNELGGKFKSVDQLLEVKGIGEKKLEAIKPFLTL